MTEDKGRGLKLVAVVLLIIACALPNMWWAPRHDPTPKQVAARLGDFVGSDRAFYLVRVFEVDSDGAWINANREESAIIFVRGEFGGVEVGDRVTIFTHVESEENIRLLRFRVHRNRSGKHLISLFALIPVALIWRREFRWDRKRRMFVGKRRPKPTPLSSESRSGFHESTQEQGPTNA